MNTMTILELIASLSSDDPRRKVLTPLVVAKLKYMHVSDLPIMEMYLKAERSEIEFLPSGVPYVVVDDPVFVNRIGAVNIKATYKPAMIINQPIILVSAIFSLEERKAVARTVFYEWSNNRSPTIRSREALELARRRYVEVAEGARKRIKPRLARRIDNKLITFISRNPIVRRPKGIH